MLSACLRLVQVDQHFCGFFFSHSCTVQHPDTIKVFYLPTDAQ
jgi:hypothetical protein